MSAEISVIHAWDPVLSLYAEAADPSIEYIDPMAASKCPAAAL